ncbi:MAG: hypothetical protein A2V67_17830 [Deltaproteobacteria bacterium RBG_13_61_14]|nr:MAG: hypothetical protein A2V67_17830 [Deltaproteobacteria bacterium RBG_13_61_14]
MSGQVYFEDVHEGDSIPALVKGPLERIQLVKYAGASGDFNPIHVDEVYAQAAGMKSVFAHGMLSMAFVGQMLTDWMGPLGELKRFQVRFSAVAWPGDVITSTGTTVRHWEEKGEGLVELALESKSQEGTVTVKGAACVRLPRRSA